MKYKCKSDELLESYIHKVQFVSYYTEISVSYSYSFERESNSTRYVLSDFRHDWLTDWL